MKFKPFAIEDLGREFTIKDKALVADVILSWARLDTFVTQMVLFAFNLSLDNGPVLLGSMTTKTKLDRLIILYQHHNMTDAAQSIANLRTHQGIYVEVRNTIAHTQCVGKLKSNPSVIVFAPVRQLKGEVDQMIVQQISASSMLKATKFANDAADKLMDVTERIAARPSERPPEPPSFLDPNNPNLQMHSKDKRS